MSVQSYENHTRWVPMWHFFLSIVLLVTLIGAVVNLVKSMGTGEGVYSASLILALVVAAIPVYYFERAFAIKVQDRAIRAEENFRHFVRFGKPLDPRLTLRQIIGLRFASDAEWPSLIEQAINENLSEADIKKAVQNWRADTYRV